MKLVTVSLGLILISLLTSCAHYNPDNHTFYGWGKVREETRADGTKIQEMESNSPLKDILNFQFLKNN